jgi:hypothetical protein
MRAKGRTVLGAVILVALVLPSSAGAVVTFGSNLTRPANIGHTTVGSALTEAIGTLPATSTAPGGQTSPMDGVIVRWRIKMGTPTTTVTLRVIRPGDSATATGAGTGEPVTPQVNTTAEILTRLPVQAGDGIGVNFADGQTLSARSDTPGATTNSWSSPPLQDIVSPPRMGTTLTDRELLINADVEPDCDRDGFGDETQDTNLSSCAPGTTPPPTGIPPPGSPPGTPPVTCKGLLATIVGTNGSDVRTGSLGQDVIAGLGGNDTLSGIAGNDVICGGGGKDLLKGGKGNDKLYGQKGNDALKGGGGNDVCKGGKGKDTLSSC